MDEEEDDTLSKMSNEELDKIERQAMARSAELRKAKAMASSCQVDYHWSRDGKERSVCRGYHDADSGGMSVSGGSWEGGEHLTPRFSHPAASICPSPVVLCSRTVGKDHATSSLPVHVIPYANGRYAVEFHYDQNLVSAVRAIPGRSWDSQKRVWSFPIAHLEDAVRAISNTSPNLQVDLTFDPSIPVPPEFAVQATSSSSSMLRPTPFTQNPLPPPCPPHPTPSSSLEQGLDSNNYSSENVRRSSSSAMPCRTSGGSSSANMRSVTVQLKSVRGDRFAAKSPYDLKLKDACKSVPQSIWDMQGKVWTFPISKLGVLVDALRRIPSLNVVLEAIPPLCLPPPPPPPSLPGAVSVVNDDTWKASESPAEATAQQRLVLIDGSSSCAANAAAEIPGDAEGSLLLAPGSKPAPPFAPAQRHPFVPPTAQGPVNGRVCGSAASVSAPGSPASSASTLLASTSAITAAATGKATFSSSNANTTTIAGLGSLTGKGTIDRYFAPQRLSTASDNPQQQQRQHHPPPQGPQHPWQRPPSFDSQRRREQQHPPLQDSQHLQAPHVLAADDPQHPRQHHPPLPQDPLQHQRQHLPVPDAQLLLHQKQAAPAKVKTVKLVPYGEGRIGLRFDFDEALVTAIKMVPSATWRGSEKLWTIQANKLEDARKAFAALSSPSSSAPVSGSASASSSEGGVLVKMETLPPLMQRALEATCAAPNDEEAFFRNSIPGKLMQALLPFQEEGVKFALRRAGRALIGDEMGLGKTLQAIAIAACYRSEWPVLVIVPSSLRLYWANMLVQWLDLSPSDITVVMPNKVLKRDEGFTVVTSLRSLSSSLRQHQREEGEGGRSSFVIVSYDVVTKAGLDGFGEGVESGGGGGGRVDNGSTVMGTMTTDPQGSHDDDDDDHHLEKKGRQQASQVHFKVVIADESHYMKNRNAKRTMACVPLIQRAARAILLTGTPALSRPIELLKQLEALQPTVYRNSFNEYGSRYCMGSPFGVFQGASNMDELHALVKSTVMIRRLKKDVLKQLPPKRRQHIFLSLDDKDLAQPRAICKQLDEVSARMKKLCVGEERELLKFDQQQLLNKLYVESAKAKVTSVQEYVGLLLDADCKFLIFAHHIELLDGISDVLRKKRLDFIRIDGNTPPTDRQNAVSRFQGNRDTRVAVLGIRAAGVGLTLTAASIVVFAEYTWTPGDLVQAEDRAHRIGQEGSSVNVYYLHAKNTIDDIIWESLQHKLDNLGQVLDGHTEGGRLELTGGPISLNPRGQTSLNTFFGGRKSVGAAGGGVGGEEAGKKHVTSSAFLMKTLMSTSSSSASAASASASAACNSSPSAFVRHSREDQEDYASGYAVNAAADGELTTMVVAGVSDPTDGNGVSRDLQYDRGMASLPPVEPADTRLAAGVVAAASERANSDQADRSHPDTTLDPSSLGHGCGKDIMTTGDGCGKDIMTGGDGCGKDIMTKGNPVRRGNSDSSSSSSEIKNSNVLEKCNEFHDPASSFSSSTSAAAAAAAAAAISSGSDSPGEMGMCKPKKLQRRG